MPENSRSSTGLGDVRNLLGFLVAGFAGVLNVLGLKSAEIGVVLRNEPFQVAIVAGFVLIAVLTAVISVFVTPERHPVSAPAAVIVLLIAASTFPLLVWVIPGPFPGHAKEHATSVAVTWSLLGAAALVSALYAVWYLGQRRARHPPVPAAAGYRGNWGLWWLRGADAPLAANPPVPEPPARKLSDLLNLQCLLLAAAVILTSTAAYGAMRVETVSQTSSVAEIGDTLLMNGRNDTLTIAVSASKLTTVDWLGVNVMAVPRHWKLAKFCHRAAVTRLRAKFGVQCVQDPCLYAAKVRGHGHCRELSEDVIAPDDTGAVQRTIDVSFAARKFQHVQVTAEACRPRVKGPKGRCLPTGAVSRLDIAVPR